jgi:hypothetical protein
MNEHLEKRASVTVSEGNLDTVGIDANFDSEEQGSIELQQNVNKGSADSLTTESTQQKREIVAGVDEALEELGGFGKH